MAMASSASRPVVVVVVATWLAGCAASGPQLVSASSGGAYEVSLAAFDDGLAAAWYDTRSGRGEIYERALDSAGRPSGPERRLTSGPADAYEADIQPLPGGFAIGWYEKSGTHLTPWLGAWTRDGVSRWSRPIAQSGRNTIVRVHDDRVFAAWIQDGDDQGPGLWAGSWRADGSPLAAPRRIAPAARTTWNLNAAVGGGARPPLFVAFDATIDTRADELFLARLDDTGVSVRRLLDDDGFASKYPDIAINSAGRAAVTWFDERDGNQEVYLWVGEASALATVRLQPGVNATRVTSTPGHSIGAYLAWNGDRLGLAWCDDSEGDHEIYLATYDANGGAIAATQRITRTAADSLIPAIHPWRSGFALAWGEIQPSVDGHGAERRGQIAATLIP
jgi:hypothetical protein